METMDYDVVIVGAGPAGLSCAIKLKQEAQLKNQQLTVCVLEKAAEVGGHILSGALMKPEGMDQLIPDWRDAGAPLNLKVSEDHFYWLSATKARKLPTPPQMRNHGNYIISLANLCRWLGEYAENLEVDIFPGFPAAELLFNDQEQVIGVKTKDVGIDANGQQKSSYQAGMAIHAKQVVLAEGCHGSLSKIAIEKFKLRTNANQTYALGVKELWQLDPSKHQPGKVVHTVGWPLDNATYGGSFMYHSDDNKLSLGFVVGLDYKNPYLDIHAELQRFKHHPQFVELFADAKLIAYGARALTEGGYQSLPQLSFPGGLLVGCAAGMVNVPEIKGSHNAILSGIIAAKELINNEMVQGKEVKSYDVAFRKSPVYRELHKVRNIRPAFKYGFYFGMAYAALDTYIFRGKAPWTLSHHHDHKSLKPADEFQPIEYPKPDGKISFNKLTSVSFSSTNHAEDQPVHLQLQDPQQAIALNWSTYGSPEQYYCPAKVYEIVKDEANNPYLQINSQNCVHCKTCDIKDPGQNINWVTPEGGDGPNYPDM